MTFQLNAQQHAVVDWIETGSGSLNLIARAGCGKTFTLIEGALRSIVTGNRGEVSLMAFNKAIADEIKAKIAKVGETEPRFLDWRRVQVGTCHSVGFSAWRRVAKDVKVEDKKVLQLIDRRALKEGRQSVYAVAAPALAKAVGLAKQSGCGFLWSRGDQHTWYELLEKHAIEDDLDGAATLEEVVRAATEVLTESANLDREVVDFDDMLLAPLLHRVRFWPKDWVLLDEAQDTNAVRRALALAILKPRTGRLIAVGDDRQAIYGFTGADDTALDLIAEQLGSRTLPLNVTYRCPKAVVREANKLVPDLTAHATAPEGVVRELRLTRPGTEAPFRDVPWFEDEAPAASSVVLCRNTKPLVAQAYALLRHGIGCRVEGREIGEGLVQLAQRWKRVTGLPTLADRLQDYQEKEQQRWLAKERPERAQAVEDRCQTLQEIIKQLSGEGKTDVAQLVAFIRNLFGDSRPGERANVLTLSTIHKAKGREWPTVYLLDRAGTLPSSWARKPWQQRQEANLEYVAITRAQRELVDLIA